jgi:hypothetical protein
MLYYVLGSTKRQHQHLKPPTQAILLIPEQSGTCLGQDVQLRYFPGLAVHDRFIFEC